MTDKVRAALAQMAAADDAQWTADGHPRIDVVRTLAKDPSITREQIQAAAPGFARTNLKVLNHAVQSQGQGQEASQEVTPPAAPDAPPPPAEDPAKDDPPTDSPEAIAEAKMIAAGKQANELLAQVDALKQKLFDAVAEHAALVTAHAKIVTGLRGGSPEINEYLKGQQAAYAERARRRQELASAMPQIKEAMKATASAPIDMHAMARRRSFR